MRDEPNRRQWLRVQVASKAGNSSVESQQAPTVAMQTEGDRYSSSPVIAIANGETFPDGLGLRARFPTRVRPLDQPQLRLVIFGREERL
jgi:hypothetical protein